MFSNINFIKKIFTFDNKYQTRELALAKGIKVLTKILLRDKIFNYNKIQLFKSN